MSTTNHLLGYPEDARLLIINADDFGMCHAHNAATLQAIAEGIVTSTTLMVPCPWAPDAVAMLRDRPEIPFGVHLTLIAELAPCRWGPVASKRDVPSLLDAAGYFHRFSNHAELLRRARIEEVEIEFRAQIDQVLAAGLRPTHLDWHCLADGGREDIFDLTLSLAREHGLAMRFHDAPHADRCRAMGLPASDHPLLNSYDYDPDEKPALYRKMLRELPAGLTEWALHPSLGSDEAQALEPDTWRIRRADFDVAISPDIREAIEAEGIVLLDYRALQRAWASASAGRPPTRRPGSR